MSVHHSFADWDALPVELREKLTLRIVIVGAESTGKTTLVRSLVQHYRGRGGVWGKTLWVSEYGRDYTVAKIAATGVGFFDPEEGDETFRTVDWVANDFAVIAREQQRLENRAARIGSPVLFCDTDAFATRVWERRYLGAESVSAFEALPELPRRALYIVADPGDVAFAQDGIRDGEHLRDEMTEWFTENLASGEERWVTVRGTGEQRLVECIRLVDAMLDQHADSFATPEYDTLDR